MEHVANLGDATSCKTSHYERGTSANVGSDHRCSVKSSNTTHYGVMSIDTNIGTKLA
jgi:hypothetical protein